MSRRATKKDLTRTQILSVAADLFAEQGYEQTSIDEIAQKADIAKGTFYYHFDSKEAVITALRVDSLTDTVQSARDALHSGSSPIRVIEQIFLERAAWTEKNPELAKVFFEERIHQFLFRENDAFVFPHTNAHIVQQVNDDKVVTSEPSNGNVANRVRFFQIIYELVLAAQEKREIRKDLEASELTQILIAIFIHAQGSWLGGYSGISLVDKVHRWLHAVLDGLYDQSYQDNELN